MRFSYDFLPKDLLVSLSINAITSASIDFKVLYISLFLSRSSFLLFCLIIIFASISCRLNFNGIIEARNHKMKSKKDAIIVTPQQSKKNEVNTDKIHKKKKKERRNKLKETAQAFYDRHETAVKKPTQHDADVVGSSFFSQCLLKNKKKNSKSEQDDLKLKKMGWGTSRFSSKPIVCRCELCELKNVVKQSAKRAKTFVLIDLDGWGWKEWALKSHKLSDNSEWDMNNQIFVWAFYGGGFNTRFLKQNMHRDIFDNYENKILREKMNTSTTTLKDKSSIFDQLVEQQLLRLSPSGWTKQSADLAIRKLVKLLIEKVNVCVISKDKDLHEDCVRIVKEQNCNGHRFVSIKPDKDEQQTTVKDLVHQFAQNTLADNNNTHVYEYIK
jgi:hypothetical protein